MLSRRLSPRFWVESLLAAAASSLFVLTLLWRDWVEVIFGIDPDRGSGAFEAAVTIALAAAAVLLIASAGSELRRALAPSPTGGGRRTPID